MWKVLLAFFCVLAVAENENRYIQYYEQSLAAEERMLEVYQIKEGEQKAIYERAENANAVRPLFTPYQIKDFFLKWELARKATERQEIKISESKVRLAIVKAMVAAGQTEIPLCNFNGGIFGSVPVEKESASASLGQYVGLFEQWVRLHGNTVDQYQTITALSSNEYGALAQVHAANPKVVTEWELSRAADRVRIGKAKVASKEESKKAALTRLEILNAKWTAGTLLDPGFSYCERPEGDVEEYVGLVFR